MGLIAALVAFLVSACGCTSKPMAACAMSELSELEELCGGRVDGVLIDDTVVLIQNHVARKIAGNQADELACLILVDGPWHGTLAYEAYVYAFARHFACSEHPIGLIGTNQCIEALMTLARSAEARRTRVRAASALRFDRRQLARDVLREEYARFVVTPVSHFGMAGWEEPPACGRTLKTLGVDWPTELTSVADVKRLLATLQTFSADKYSDDVLAEAANQYNTALRETVLSDGDVRMFVTMPDKADYLHSLCKTVSNDMSPSIKQTRLFAK